VRRAHEYVGLIDIMHPATLHSVGVNNNLYFAICAAFKESVTLSFAQRSFKVIDCGTNRKWSIATWPCLAPFRRYGGLNVENRQFFRYLTPIPAKIWGCFFWSSSVMLVSTYSEMVRLISREIIFQEFQPIWSRYLNVTSGRTDRRTDNLAWQYRAPQPPLGFAR